MKNSNYDKEIFLFSESNCINMNQSFLFFGSCNNSTETAAKGIKHDYCEIIFIKKGMGSIIFGDQLHKIKKGDLIINNAGNEHYEKYQKDTEIFFLAINNIQIEGLSKDHLIPEEHKCIYKTDGDYYIFLNLFEEMTNEYKKKKLFYSETAQAMASAVIFHALRTISSQSKDMELVQKHRVVETAEQYIRENYNKNITLDDIADKCYVNKFYLSHLFSYFNGVSVGKYIMNIKINESKNLLKKTDLPINDISDRVGFRDSNYFSRSFKKQTTMTPGEYRCMCRDYLPK